MCLIFNSGLPYILLLRTCIIMYHCTFRSERPSDLVTTGKGILYRLEDITTMLLDGEDTLENVELVFIMNCVLTAYYL